MTYLVAIVELGGLTLLLGIFLWIAYRRLYVQEDERIDILEAQLPGANCGACGHPGCRQFAQALVNGDSEPAKCTVSTEAQLQQIARTLGVAVGSRQTIVARLACAGGSHVSRFRAQYHGLPNCRAAATVANAGKMCSWGCLGFGDCAQVCDFDAITMSAQNLPEVEPGLCVACGDCVDICPQDLYSLQAAENRLWIACNNRQFGDEILADCEVACTTCGRCAMDAATGLITMEDNLAVIHYDHVDPDHAPLDQTPMQRCPTGAIVWLDEHEHAVKARRSRKIVRQKPLPLHDS